MITEPYCASVALVAAILAVWFTFVLTRGIRTGEYSLLGYTIKRSEDPGLYWRETIFLILLVPLLLLIAFFFWVVAHVRI
jgi:hypothetical protein